VVIIGFTDDLRYLDRFDQLDDVDVIGEYHLAHRFADRA
jgi:hypothetical protein